MFLSRGLRGQMVESLVGLLAHRLIHLHLQDQVRAALQVEPQLDARPKILAQLSQGRGKGGQAKQPVETQEDHGENKDRFPSKIGIHDRLATSRP